MLLMQMSMLILKLLPGYYSWTVTQNQYMQFCSVVNIQQFVTVVQKLGTFKIVLLILVKVNDKRNVLLLYLLDRHIYLQITAGWTSLF